MRKQKKTVLQKEQLFYTTCVSETCVSVAANVKEHVPEAHTPGATAQQRTEFVTAMLSKDMHLLPKNPKGITNLN